MPDFSQFIAPSPRDDYVALGRTQKGRLFRKHILNKGELLHPTTGEKISIDDAFITKLNANFTNGVCDIVQVPKAGPRNEHTEDPDRNIGEVTGLDVEGDKVYALIDARTEDADKLGKTLLGASAMMHLNYTDTRTGQKVGPTLLHVAVTNRPYVTGLDEYQELVAMSAEGTDETTVLLSAATEMEKDMTLDEILALLKDEHGIDVPALQANAGADTTKLSQAATALASVGILKLSNGTEVQADEIVSGVSELVSNNVQLSNRVQALEADAQAAAAETLVDSLIAEGRIIPAQKASMVELRLSNNELFDKLVPETPIVALSREDGQTPVDHSPVKDLDATVARYAAMANGTAK